MSQRFKNALDLLWEATSPGYKPLEPVRLRLLEEADKLKAMQLQDLDIQLSSLTAPLVPKKGKGSG